MISTTPCWKPACVSISRWPAIGWPHKGNTMTTTCHSFIDLAAFAQTAQAGAAPFGADAGRLALRGGPVEPGDEDRLLGIAGSPEELHIVICGGPAGNFPTFLQTYAESFEVISRKITIPHEKGHI
mgnify:CR=1 FL=1